MNKYKLRLILALIFLLIEGNSFCQSTTIDIRNLYKTFELSINQSSKKDISIASGEWVICNADSAFFKADTIKMYDNINYFYQLSKCCRFVGWTFYKKDAFIQSQSQICDEPSSGSVKTVFAKLRLSSENKKVFLSVLRLNIPVEKFEVISLERITLAQNNFSKIITLKRLSQTISSP